MENNDHKFSRTLLLFFNPGDKSWLVIGSASSIDLLKLEIYFPKNLLWWSLKLCPLYDCTGGVITFVVFSPLILKLSLCDNPEIYLLLFIIFEVERNIAETDIYSSCLKESSSFDDFIFILFTWVCPWSIWLFFLWSCSS